MASCASVRHDKSYLGRLGEGVPRPTTFQFKVSWREIFLPWVVPALDLAARTRPGGVLALASSGTVKHSLSARALVEASGVAFSIPLALQSPRSAWLSSANAHLRNIARGARSDILRNSISGRAQIPSVQGWAALGRALVWSVLVCLSFGVGAFLRVLCRPASSSLYGLVA